MEGKFYTGFNKNAQKKKKKKIPIGALHNSPHNSLWRLKSGELLVSIYKKLYVEFKLTRGSIRTDRDAFWFQ